MNDEFTETTRLKLRWLLPFRNYLTPAILWTAIGFLATGIIFVGKKVYTVDQHQESIAELQKSIAKLVDQSQDTRLDIAAIKVIMGDMKAEQDREREWRDRLADIAEGTAAREAKDEMTDTPKEAATKEDVESAKREILTHLREGMEGFRQQQSAEHGSFFTKLSYITEIAIWIKNWMLKVGRIDPPNKTWPGDKK